MMVDAEHWDDREILIPTVGRGPAAASHSEGAKPNNNAAHQSVQPDRSASLFRLPDIRPKQPLVCSTCPRGVTITTAIELREFRQILFGEFIGVEVVWIRFLGHGNPFLSLELRQWLSCRACCFTMHGALDCRSFLGR